MSRSGGRQPHLANVDAPQRIFDFGRRRRRGANAVIARTFPDPATATPAQLEFALLACEATLTENADADPDDDRAFFLSALFAIAAACRADLHCRLRDSVIEDEVRHIIAHGDERVVDDHDHSD